MKEDSSAESRDPESKDGIVPAGSEVSNSEGLTEIPENSHDAHEVGEDEAKSKKPGKESTGSSEANSSRAKLKELIQKSGEPPAASPQQETLGNSQPPAISNDAGDVHEPSGQLVEPDFDPLEERRKKALPVDKTKLDTEALRDMASKTVAEREEKIKEELDSRPVEPPKPVKVIDKFKTSGTCGMKWESMQGADRVRFCEKCQLRVYNFDGMDRAEAEEILLKHENKANATLYKRRDGTFLTSGCPVAARRTVTNLSVAGSLLAFLAGSVFLLSDNEPPKTAAPPEGKSAAIKIETAGKGGKAHSKVSVASTSTFFLDGCVPARRISGQDSAPNCVLPEGPDSQPSTGSSTMSPSPSDVSKVEPAIPQTLPSEGNASNNGPGSESASSSSPAMTTIQPNTGSASPSSPASSPASSPPPTQPAATPAQPAPPAQQQIPTSESASNSATELLPKENPYVKNYR
jgi:hypothetical protein